MEQETHYDSLGLDHQTCDLEDIKKAYRRLALQYHPDRVAPELQEEATEQFQRITDAYEILSNGPKRLRYDRELNLQGVRPTNYPQSKSKVAEEPGNYFNKNKISKQSIKHTPLKVETDKHEEESKLARIFKHKYCRVGIIVTVFAIFMVGVSTGFRGSSSKRF